MRIDGNAWDYRDFEICYASTPDGGVFFDIGANVGYFTVEMVALTGSKVTSIGFEANASLTSAIARTIEINGYAENLIIVDALVGDRDGEAKFFIAPASIHSSAVADSNRGVTHAITKRMIALDTIVGSGELPPPDFIKMDIEGSEHLAFRGGAKMLREHRPHIFFEYLHEDDIGGRVRAEFEALVLETGCYDVYVSPSSNLRARHASMLVPYSGPEDLTNSDAVYLRNRQRPVRNADIFGI